MRDDSVPSPKPTDDLPDDRLIVRYVAGDCTLPERVAMERWIAAHPDYRTALETMCVDGQVLRNGWSDGDDVFTADRILLERIGVRVEETSDSQDIPAYRTSGSAHKQNSDSGLRQRSPLWGRSRAMAYSVIAGVMGLGIIITATVTTSGWLRGRVQTSSRVSIHATGNGQRATLTLSDGSTVLLNAASRLEVPVDYDRGNRNVRLYGEALFSVVHQKDRPFSVTAGHSITRVLGTSFVVRHYETDTATTVAVRDGKVMVQSTILTAEQQVSVGTHGVGPVIPASVNQFSFASGILSFDGIPLIDAIPQLNRWYDADIRLGDSALLARRVVGGFRSGSLTDLSSILEVMFDVSIAREGRVLTLYPNKQ